MKDSKSPEAVKDLKSPWAGLGGLGALAMLPALFGQLGRHAKKAVTKTEKAQRTSENITRLVDEIMGMTSSGQYLVGTEGQDTLSPFNADVNAQVARLITLHRRALIAKSKLHRFTFPKWKGLIDQLAEDVEKAESDVAKVLSLPDKTPEQENAEKEAESDKSLVVQALSLCDDQEVSAIVTASGLPIERVTFALGALVAEKIAETKDGKFKLLRYPAQP